MTYIYIFVLILSLMLAVMSRIHFSKYKDRGRIKALFFSVGETMYTLLYRYLPVDRVKLRMKEVEALSENKLENVVKSFFVRMLALAYGVVVICSILSWLMYSEILNDSEKTSNQIIRPEYGGDEAKVDMMLYSEGKEHAYQLALSPQEYSKEEFEENAELVFEWLETEILGENTDLEHVSSDLRLVTCDKNKIFDIVWETGNPGRISSSGMLRPGVGNEDTYLVARIEYLNYEASHQFNIKIVEKEEDSTGIFDEAISRIEDIEAAERENKKVILPDMIGDVRVDISRENNNTGVMIFVLGIIVIICLCIKQSDDIKKMKTARDNMLIYKYAELINHLWLYLGTGMTIKKALCLYAGKDYKNNVLKREIMYTMNKIQTGMDEIEAYAELGNRLNIPQYSRLFGHICQNMRMGTKNIRDILEAELCEAESLRKEKIKRKGEEASTKLIIPMVIMLAVVMVIIMVPAFTGYV